MACFHDESSVFSENLAFRTEVEHALNCVHLNLANAGLKLVEFSESLSCGNERQRMKLLR